MKLKVRKKPEVVLGRIETVREGASDVFYVLRVFPSLEKPGDPEFILPLNGVVAGRLLGVGFKLGDVVRIEAVR